MLYRTLGTCALFVCSLAIGSDEVLQINSWADYRAALIAGGKAPADADREISTLIAAVKDVDRTAGKDRVGVAAPPFQFDAWLNSKPLSVEDLRGHVVLVRWWTDTCPYCATTAPALRKLDQQYAAKSLKVIGVYHPKPPGDGAIDLARVRKSIDARQLAFPIAIDWNWRTLRSWWLTGPDRPGTSVTFLVDKKGVIRYVHPGMEYHDANGDEEHAACGNDFSMLRAAVEKLISE